MPKVGAKNAKRATPAIARKPREKLPIVCETFQILILKLLSFCENQWVMIRPHGGQPIPDNQPTTSMRKKMTVVFNAVLAP